MVCSRSHVESIIDLSVHSIFNFQIVLECRCFVLTLRNLFGTFGLEGKYLEVTRVSIGTVLSEERRGSFK